MLMHAPPCVPDCNLALSLARVSLPGGCWQGVGQDTADAALKKADSSTARTMKQAGYPK